MGNCADSKSAAGKPNFKKPAATNQKLPSATNIQPHVEEEEEDDPLKDYDKFKSINLLDSNAENVLTSSVETALKEGAANIIQKQAKRKAAKLRAEKESRWLVFSNFDLAENEDMICVAKFMAIIFQKASDIDKILHDDLSAHEKHLNSLALEKLYETDSNPTVSIPSSPILLSPHHSQNVIDVARKNSTSIDIVRKNSQDFLSALRTIRETTDQVRTSQIAKSGYASAPQSGKIKDNPLLGSVSEKSPLSINSPDESKRNRYWNTSNNKPHASDALDVKSSPDVSGRRVSVRSNGSVNGSLTNSNYKKSDKLTSSGLTETKNLTDIFTFEKIALSSELEKTTTLEDIIPDEEHLKNNFDLPVGNISPYSVDLLIALYKKQGKLSSESLYKVLRVSFRKMKEMKNISYVEIVRSFERVTVVGDLHGK